ncbi:CAAX amino terminal protease self- immunity [Roseovarius sp. THAF27]|uniref:CPBP family intramembrane glutamic endopeptidase n=1 Tax=Roseovarius sp. THAF27 TaxID=2587850 RepID=UPI001268D0B9|nr:CPBP family intramembrane glutamic endopeptidase [Roseovarius sp. THAF27]QFT82012.1 CAAX amino terminal protease self- immunity [Roseovarius sp. THAF27]
MPEEDVSKRRLCIELLSLFILAPVILAVFLPSSAMLPVLLCVTVLGMFLLHRTPGFHWRDLTQGWGKIDWRVVAGFAVATTLACVLVQTLFLPDRWFALYQMNGWAWLLVMALYPIVSALPQEVVFRPLFFRRYAPILPASDTALIANAAVFSMAHLLYWNVVVMVMTFIGGLVFAWAYKVRNSFPMAVVLHAVAGNILFTLGTGFLFYTGSIERPF